ncbi:hypothetical protein IQ235_07905 [Oscillatoriales cyanobacterium LEGE 11467]|uniref:Uncharacterized protein n=1 Tax=Zarconia navalis LEGE 11467 TaxID=1828826 RepID=A0A928Z6S5_9CYAN|nr:hypothetical protein [Zarconia navalis]MBE9040702.1 hypothetical protein [Zarconia navalis LEGE 11467]
MITSDSLTQIQSYLQQRVEQMRKYGRPDRKYCCFEELILDRGVAMTAASKPPKLKRGLPKSCYYNCQQVAFGRKTLTYVEGYAISADIPMAIAHGWLANDKGEAIELTWEEPGIAYLGIPFSTKWVKAFLKQRNRPDSLSIFEGNYLEEFSLLKDGIPTEAIVSLQNEVVR